MQYEPSARELVAAVAEYLEAEVVPALTEPRLRYRTLVAINVLQIVARELSAQSAGMAIEWSRLAALLGRPPTDAPVREADLTAEVAALNHELGQRIRAGAFDEPARFAEALGVAESAIVEKLLVSNPRFVARLGIA